MRTLTSILLVTFSYAASADQEYWISVASFASSDRAESAAPQIGEQISQRVQVVPDANHIRYRVAVGPISSRDEAETTLDQIKGSGIPDAWILASESTSNYEQFERSGEALPQWQSDLPEEPEYIRSETLGFGSRANQNRTDTEPAPLAEPPPGYQLNKLRRTQ